MYNGINHDFDIYESDLFSDGTPPPISPSSFIPIDPDGGGAGAGVGAHATITDVDLDTPWRSLSQGDDTDSLSSAQPHEANPTRTGSGAKNWVFTLNSYSVADVDRLNGLACSFIHYQAEIGLNGNKHLQGLVCFPTRKTLATLKREIGRAHWEIMRGTVAQALAYASKLETRDPAGPTSTRGTRPPGKGARSDLAEITQCIKRGATEAQIFEEHPDMFLKYHAGVRKAISLRPAQRTWKTQVHWYYGPTGTGKTRRAFEQAPEAYWKDPCTPWWDGYTGQSTVIIDDYRCDFSKFAPLLRLLDRYPVQLQIKGGTMQFLATTIYISSPRSPKDMWSHRSEEDLQQLFRRIDTVTKWTGIDEFAIVPNDQSDVIDGDVAVVNAMVARFKPR